MENSERGGATLALDGSRLDALELILEGLVAPIDGYCLPGQKPDGWPFESVLAVPSSVAAAALVHGKLTLTDPDGTPLASLAVPASAGTDDSGNIAGTLTALRRAEHPPARDIRLSLADGPPDVVAIFATEPEPAQLARAIVSASGRTLLFLIASWNMGHADYTISKAVNSLRRCSAEVPGSSARFVALAPLAPDMSRATVLAHVLGILGAGSTLDFSPGEDPGSDLASSEQHEGCVVLFTGLSGSGKSTVARALSERLAGEGLRRTVLLDGDDVRRILSPSLGFTERDREENLRRVGWVAARIGSVGGVAICAPIAPFARMRAEIRAMAEETSRFILVYVATPLAVCETRDRKGLYARARAGEITDFTGIDSPYEAPDDADIVIDTTAEAVDDQVDAIIRLITPQGDFAQL
ncbi:MAG: adenylylsulfate kinase [Microbacteriaceae bacterium]|nr:adenylylsulfate kinase [Microbacteriaceae bacterium]